MIKLTEFIRLPEDKKNIKIKFNMNPNDTTINALDLLLDDSEEWIKMNAYKSKQPSNNLADAKYLITFAQYYPYGSNYYIFGGIYEVEKILPEVFDNIGYKLTLADLYTDYIKRLIIKIKKPIGRNIYTRLYSNVQEQLEPEIYELSPSTKLGKFPGYNNILLTHKNLQRIVQNNEPEWRQALSKIKGVYIITDTSSGKLYIGSASGNNEGIWQRWCAYANLNNLTGGNKVFENIKTKDVNHIINNFTYAILEIFDPKTNREYILQREVYWKKVFKSVNYGMNLN